MMATWREEYMTALKEREKVEKANYDIIDACEYASPT
jgi:hypothetical protein